MMRWDKTAVQFGMNGEKTIIYRAEGCACKIESVKQAIRHANGEGYWYHTEYVVWYPDGASRVFQRLRDAQAEAEKYGKKFERRST